MRNVSVIGLGAMGSALAQALLRSGYHVTVWNRTASKCRPLADAGAAVAGSVTEAVVASPVVVICVLDHASSDALLRTPEVVSKLPGKLLVQLSTGTPQQAREAAVWVKEAGVSFLEGAILAAPEEIGTHEALLVFSGARPLFDVHREVLQSLGNAVFVGEESSHAAALDCAVMSVFFGAAMGFLQGAVFCDAERLPVQTLAAALEQWFTGTMRVFQRGAERIATQRYGESKVSVAVGTAALDLLTAVAAEKRLDSGFLESIAHYFKKAMAAGYAREEWVAVLEVLRGK